MDEMNAFERQVAAEVVGEMPASRSVDTAAVLSAAVTSRSRKWRFEPMFNATKYLVATAIVALFAGILLAGILRTSSGDAAPVVGASPTAEVATELPIQLPTDIPAGVDTGTLDTPLGPARWVHLVGDAADMPRMLDSIVSAPEGFVVADRSEDGMQLWRSPDLVEWLPFEVGIEADWGGLTQTPDGTIWIDGHEPAGLWRSDDTVIWEPVSVDDLQAPGPQGYAWAMELHRPVVRDGTTVVPFSWQPDHALLTRDLVPGAEWLDLSESEPGLYELIDYRTDPSLRPTVRFEETPDGVQVVDDADGTVLKEVDGISWSWVEAMLSPIHHISSVQGLATMDGDSLAEVELDEYMRSGDQLTVTTDGAGFTAYRVGGGLLDIYRSQYGRGWHHAGTIGDEAGEPAGIAWINDISAPTTLVTTNETAWTTSDGLQWDEEGPAEYKDGRYQYRLGDGWIQSLMGMTGDPMTGEVDPDRIWYEPASGDAVPIDISGMAFAPGDCGGSDGLISGNTMVTSIAEECGGRREIWVITFDDLPA